MRKKKVANFQLNGSGLAVFTRHGVRRAAYAATLSHRSAFVFTGYDSATKTCATSLIPLTITNNVSGCIPYSKGTTHSERQTLPRRPHLQSGTGLVEYVTLTNPSVHTIARGFIPSATPASPNPLTVHPASYQPHT